MRCQSHVDIDLASSKLEAALHALSWMKKLSNKVKTAHVHANSLFNNPIGSTGSRYVLETSHLLTVFDALGSLPNLRSLDIEFSFSAFALPVSALIAVLKGKHLRQLHLKNLQIVGCGEEFDMLDKLLAEQTKLRVVSLDCCRGASAIRSLVRSPPALKEIKLTSTALAPYGTLREDTIVNLVTPTLQILKLDDVPELDDSHVYALTIKLAAPDARLQELHLTSSTLTDCAGKDIAGMLATNSSIQTLTLHLDAERMALYMARVLKSNTSLQRLDMRVYSDRPKDLTQNALHLAETLRYNNSSLKHLKLRFEIEMESLPLAIVQGFDTTLQKNETLTTVSFDDGSYRYPLPKPMALRLQLNQAKVPSLLRAQTHSHSQKYGHQTTSAANQLLETMIESATKPYSSQAEEAIKLDVTYHILRNMPSLLLQCNHHESTTSNNTISKCDSITKKQHHHHRHFSLKVPIDWKLPSLTKSLRHHSFSSSNKHVVPRVA